MKFKEFLEYMEKNLDGYQVFMGKAMDFQKTANNKRKSKWPDGKIEKAAYDMWKKSMENLYNTIKAQVKSDLTPSWINFIKNNDILSSVNEGISEMYFSDTLE